MCWISAAFVAWAFGTTEGLAAWLMPTRPMTAAQLGLSRQIQALCAEPEGLVLVGGPRLSGKTTLVSACVDLINRSRADYIITLETEITFVHERRRGMVSQREVRGDQERMLALARAALLEKPDVLVIDDLRSPEMVALAIDSGRMDGMVPMNDALLAFVRSGAVDAREAYRKAFNRPALMESLRREHIDRSSAGRQDPVPLSVVPEQARSHHAGASTGAVMAGDRKDHGDVHRRLQDHMVLPDLEAGIQTDAARSELPEVPVGVMSGSALAAPLTRPQPHVASLGTNSRNRCLGCGSGRDLHRARLRPRTKGGSPTEARSHSTRAKVGGR